MSFPLLSSDSSSTTDLLSRVQAFLEVPQQQQQKAGATSDLDRRLHDSNTDLVVPTSGDSDNFQLVQLHDFDDETDKDDDEDEHDQVESDDDDGHQKLCDVNEDCHQELTDEEKVKRSRHRIPTVQFELAVGPIDENNPMIQLLLQDSEDDPHNNCTNVELDDFQNSPLPTSSTTKEPSSAGKRSVRGGDCDDDDHDDSYFYDHVDNNNATILNGVILPTDWQSGKRKGDKMEEVGSHCFISTLEQKPATSALPRKRPLITIVDEQATTNER